MQSTRREHQCRNNNRASRFIAMGLALCVAGCAGPQPLGVAINPVDEDAYVAELNDVNGDARTGFANWMAKRRQTQAHAILASDADFSSAKNPFDAHRDPSAVSRGAVTYKIHCARCHGINADGIGPFALPEFPATSFKTFSKRFAATLHRGAPKKWFRVIRDGSGDMVDYPTERTTAMPPFGDKLTREQAWLVITYLQSLDAHAGDAQGKDS